MEKKTKGIIATTVLASAFLAATSANANPFAYKPLGSGEEVRTSLLNKENSNKNLELACGAKNKSTAKATANKGKDGKCGEGKCGDKKASGANTSTAKANTNTKKKGN